jgi:hypothetical protein
VKLEGASCTYCVGSALLSLSLLLCTLKVWCLQTFFSHPFGIQQVGSILPFSSRCASGQVHGPTCNHSCKGYPEKLNINLIKQGHGHAIGMGMVGALGLRGSLVLCRVSPRRIFAM